MRSDPLTAFPAQVMEEKLDINNVEVACVKMPPLQEVEPVGAACHYVPGPANKQVAQFKTYTKPELEAAIARVAAAASAAPAAP